MAHDCDWCRPGAPHARCRGYPPGNDVDFWLRIIVVLDGSLLVPWVHVVLERADFFEGDFEGLDWRRALWLVPLFYLLLAQGTVLLFAAHLDVFWAFHLLLVAQLGEWFLHEAGYLTSVTLPFATRFTLPRVGGFLVALGGVIGACRWLQRWITAREYRAVVGDGQYLLPFRSVSDTSGEL